MAVDENEFVYKGFNGHNISLEGVAKIHSNGLLQLTNFSKHQIGRAFYKHPIRFDTSSSTLPQDFSFSTHFVFAIVPEATNRSSDGMAFAISPSMDFNQAVGNQYFGLLNSSNNSNHLLAIELDTQMNPEFHDINDNHVGIDVNSLLSKVSAPVTYYSNRERINRSLELVSGNPMHVWIEYDGFENVLNVTLAPTTSPKPDQSLMSTRINLSSILLDSMYVGFSAATGPIPGNHYILGWSFNKRTFYMLRWKKYEEILEDWEREYGPHRFSYKDLFKATRGFIDEELLGAGGFGKVYRGVLPSSKEQVAVKKVSHDSKQGMKEFVAEIASMGRLRHRNLVQLLGYCRRKGELLLLQQSPGVVVLVDWVFEKWKEGAILETSDPRLGGDYLGEEMVLVLKLGLLCSKSDAATRPSMRQVMQYLDGDVLLPEIIHDSTSIGTIGPGNEASFEFVTSFPSSTVKSSALSISSTECTLTSGR
ncbi:hypothetical protein RHGRI_002490 [Rhododendron griersonianum]|uniref:non-specific serine/threonine protein kinase n=1 Tax=Rhododendron griersonianum TaxID=479676 RepID=A0AAV6LS85_9ERIC|nr:hypothetical protein RHGRI_002490 [Rhododendron griersonianum]